ncbi:uncharacterized protein [Dermacentor albipictus]|uniref:uncharacterized protein n=1 Tax=Dermacentor albipictus TaxID=60249 RepID=UPI0031FD7DE2
MSGLFRQTNPEISEEKTICPLMQGRSPPKTVEESIRHVISKSGVRLDQQKTAAIAKFPQHIDKKAVRRFLGMCAYYRRFVKDFSRIEEPLTHLTKCDVEFKWETLQADECSRHRYLRTSTLIQKSTLTPVAEASLPS